MKKIYPILMAATLTMSMSFFACQENELIEEIIVEVTDTPNIMGDVTNSPMLEAYNAAWVEKLGEVDPNHDWNAAMQVTAKFNLNGENKVRIYTTNPINPNCKLLADTEINGSGSVSFDVLKTQEMVYIKVTNDKTTSISKYYNITKNTIETRDYSASRAVETCNTSIGETIDLGTYQHPDEGQYGWGWRNYGKLHYLKDVKVNTTTCMIDDLKPILGNNGVLPEGVDNRSIWMKKEYNPNVELIVTETGPISISFMCGGTVHYNQFGYFYYSTDQLEEKINANKYVLIDDARPGKNILCEGVAPKAMQMPTWVQGTEYEKHDGHTITSKEYHLVYFDKNGNVSYTFPKGIHIGFFIIKAVDGIGDNEDFAESLKINQSNNFGSRIAYSLPELNAYYNKFYNTEAREGEIPAITFNYKDGTYMGFEDNTYGDKDMNDIFFNVTGNFVEPKDPTLPDPQSWIIACEDLGSVYDLDFNDVVFSISHIGGSEIATITPLAAGGILPAYIKYKGNRNNAITIGNKEFHELFVLPEGVNVQLPINAKAKEGYTTQALPIEIKVPKDFSLSSRKNDIKNFSIEIMQYENQSVVANTINYGQGIELNPDGDAKAKAPMMLYCRVIGNGQEKKSLSTMHIPNSRSGLIILEPI